MRLRVEPFISLSGRFVIVPECFTMNGIFETRRVGDPDGYCVYTWLEDRNRNWNL